MPTPPKDPSVAVEVEVDLAVIGAGPGGYTAAFRAADLGLTTALIERHPTLGGVCLNVGCIPSKSLLHLASIIDQAAHAKDLGVTYPAPKLNLARTRAWKDSVISQLTAGLSTLAKKRKVQVIHGEAHFTSPNHLAIAPSDPKSNANAPTQLHFKNAIIATGSTPTQIPQFPHADPRVMDSTDALLLQDIPKTLLVVGGGIIGLEMAAVYHALGSRITIVEQLGALFGGTADPDIIRPLQTRIKKEYADILLNTRVTEMSPTKTGIRVTLKTQNGEEKTQTFAKALISIGRTPSPAAQLQPQAAGITINETGFIPVDRQQRTNIPHIFAIGDIVGQPMLAHKATHQGKIAAEVAAGMGKEAEFDARVIPSVAYTHPEVAWVGITETEAKQRGLDYQTGIFPWAASGRALSQADPSGTTKLILAPDHRIIGAAITGNHAGDLIAEAALAIEMGADAEDLALTIHPHPTLSETLNFAAEAALGTITDLYLPKKK